MHRRCSDCGDRTADWHEVDGTTAVLCRACVRESAAVAWAHEAMRRLHLAAHGYERPCPVCEREAAEAHR